MPPETIGGRYEVQREIGRGGMGAVYLCNDRLLGRDVAAKQLGGLPGESTPHLARALREARTSAALSHPNVVSIYDAVEEGHHVWLVMEYLPSRTLSQVIREEGPLSPGRAAHVGAQIADGLAAAHSRGTVHRDVKPGNVLVGEDDHAKISDFGIARSVDDETLTQTGMVTGTPMYFSPQLARGLTATPADDVWALGATLYSAVEGEAPWPSQENSLALLVHIAENPAPEPRRAGPLSPIIHRMMAADPDDRPAMAEVAHELRAVAHAASSDEQGTLALPLPAPAPEVHEPTRERPVVAAVPTAPPAPPAPPAQPRPTPAAAVPYEPAAGQHPRRWMLPLLGIALAVLVVVAAAFVTADLVGGDGSDPAADASDTPTAGSTSDGGSDAPGDASEPASDSTPEDSPPTTAVPPPTSAETGSTDEVATTSPESFVNDYYALLPADTRAAWDLLSDEMQAQVGSYGSYQAFWRTIEAVSVDDTVAESTDTVAVQLTYDTAEGTESETRLITVQDTGEGPQIVGDQVAS